ncbi:hypothetical protein R3P38DRAFT_1192328 [Favolaschia claudopus]|uniref:Uncharacterized protein n=1 Tax=Favolaschia claudopus TaxID=2862362 RepID=A0AAW0E554_9AGAR
MSANNALSSSVPSSASSVFSTATSPSSSTSPRSTSPAISSSSSHISTSVQSNVILSRTPSFPSLSFSSSSSQSATISSPSHSLTPFPTFSPPSISVAESIPSQDPANIVNAQSKSLMQRPGIIAAIASASLATLLLAALVLFFCRRRRHHRQVQLGSSITSQEVFMRDHPHNENMEDSPHSLTGSAGWPSEEPVWASQMQARLERWQSRQSVNSTLVSTGKAPPMPMPHYTVRSHASMINTNTDVYGFGQDLAWKEAHYEEPLPAVRPLPPSNSASYPDIEVIPPTPRAEIIYPNMPSAVPLMRSASTASSARSEYSAESMVRSQSSPSPVVQAF